MIVRIRILSKKLIDIALYENISILDLTLKDTSMSSTDAPAIGEDSASIVTVIKGWYPSWSRPLCKYAGVHNARNSSFSCFQINQLFGS